jgi:hypothetical protein
LRKEFRVEARLKHETDVRNVIGSEKARYLDEVADTIETNMQF